MKIMGELAALLLGITGGLVVAGAVYALLTFLGVMTRIIGCTHTGHLVKLYEWIVCAGCTMGAVFSIYIQPSQGIARLLCGYGRYEMSADAAGAVASCLNGLENVLPVCWQAAAFFFTLCAGVYVGCLIMSLAENLNVLPILCRTLRIHHGFPAIITSIALGKAVGALLYYWHGW